MDAKSTYTLDAEKLADAIAIIDGETNELKRIAQIRDKSLTRINAIIYIFTAGAAALFILPIHELIIPETAVFYGLIFFAAYMLVAIIFSYESLRAFYRLRRVQRGLGLQPEKYFVTWQEFKSRIPLMIPFVAGLLIAGGSLAAWAYYYSNYRIYNPWFLDLAVLSYLLGLLISINLVESKSAEKLKERLLAGERLRASLLSRQKASTDSGQGLTISMPEAEYKEIARIEKALIDLRRQRAIRQSHGKAETSALEADESQREDKEYAPIVTLDAKTELEGFSPELQSEVKQIIKQLAQSPGQFEHLTRKQYEEKRFLKGDKNLSYIYQHPAPPLEITYQLQEDANPRIIRFVHFAEIKLAVKKILFISYSHEDKAWLDKIVKFLKSLESHDITFWSDLEILAGDKWQDEINKALKNAKAALLLVSQDFLNSEFIKHKELPTLLDKAKTEGLEIFWIPVRPSTIIVEKHPITAYQAAIDNPEISIFELEPPQQERQFVNMRKKIVEALAE